VRLQSIVGKEVRARKTPILIFKPDQTIRAAERIERILHDQATMPPRPEPPAADDGEA
jgi:ribosome-binding factor A